MLTKVRNRVEFFAGMILRRMTRNENDMKILRGLADFSIAKEEIPLPALLSLPMAGLWDRLHTELSCHMKDVESPPVLLPQPGLHVCLSSPSSLNVKPFSIFSSQRADDYATLSGGSYRPADPHLLGLWVGS